MDDEERQVIEIGSLETGTKVDIVNRTNSAKKYVFKNGEYGEISFTLIVGAECTFTVGSVTPVIEMHDTDDKVDVDLSPYG